MTPLQRMTGRSWGVLLAGGDGTRLRSLTTQIEGDRRPKQFSRLIGEESLINQTRRRVLPLFGSDRIKVVVTRDHEMFYTPQLSDLPSNALVVQPENRGTGIAIAVAVAALLEQDAEAVVAFFPCDHYYADEAAFLSAAEAALSAVAAHPARLVLLGAEPSHPETDYGWIEPERTNAVIDFEPAQVRRFWEKPLDQVAEELLDRGGLWNTFVTFGKASTFLNLLCTAVPEAMLALSEDLFKNGFQPTFRNVPFVDFSRDVLSQQVEHLLVIRDRASGWTDLGRPSRLLETLSEHNLAPAWLRAGISRGAPTTLADLPGAGE